MKKCLFSKINETINNSSLVPVVAYTLVFNGSWDPQVDTSSASKSKEVPFESGKKYLLEFTNGSPATISVFFNNADGPGHNEYVKDLGTNTDISTFDVSTSSYKKEIKTLAQAPVYLRITNFTGVVTVNVYEFE